MVHTRGESSVPAAEVVTGAQQNAGSAVPQSLIDLCWPPGFHSFRVTVSPPVGQEHKVERW